MAARSRDEMIEYLATSRIPLKAASGMVLTENGLVLAAKLRDAQQSLRAELSAIDEESLKARYDAFIERQRKQAEETEAAHSWNQPYGRANFDHWAKMEYWTVDEGIALLLGRSPGVLKWDNVKHFTLSSPVVHQFASIREAAERAVLWKTLHTGNRPGAFILWAKRFEYPVPGELEEKVKKFGHFMGDWHSNYMKLYEDHGAAQEANKSNTERLIERYDSVISGWKQQCATLTEQSKKNHETAMSLLDQRTKQISELQSEVARLTNESKSTPTEKPLGQRERDTLHKLIIGLAIGGYGYDPKASRSGIPAQIVNDLLLHGLTITDDTVRTHLRDAAELLPPPNSPDVEGNKR